jgi:hypothetical protein
MIMPRKTFSTFQKLDKTTTDYQAKNSLNLYSFFAINSARSGGRTTFFCFRFLCIQHGSLEAILGLTKMTTKSEAGDG